MFEPSSGIIGLEVGTSKVCAAVGEITPQGGVNIIALGQAKSRGVRKGEIVDTAKAEEDIRNAIAEAETMANLEATSVFLGVTGSHLRGFNNRGVHPIVSADREIGEEDVQKVIQNAKLINLPPQNHVICAIRQHFTVDDQDAITDPVGMLGSRLEVDVHVLHGNLNRLQNAIRTVKGMQVEVEDIVFNGLASSLSVLSNEQKELGALTIDIGGGTTEYVLYANGIVKHTGVLAVGGDHVSNDLAYGLKCRLRLAEELKLKHGSAIADDSVKGQTLNLNSEFGMPGLVVNMEHLRMIMSVRLEEIFQLILQDLESANVMHAVRAGVFLTGGGARIPRIAELAAQVLRVPVSIGRVTTINGLPANLDQPEFATAIGLVKYGSFQQRRKATRGFLRDALGTLFRRNML